MKNNIYEFEHVAMNSPIRLALVGDDEKYAYSAAQDAFYCLDHIESLLSQYVPDSETDILNTSNVGRVFKLAYPTARCLTTACNISAVTEGAVDVCMGEFFLEAKHDTNFGKISVPRRAQFEIDYENLLIRKTAEGRIDLGCIGKGFGVDEMVSVLRNPWKISGAFVSFTSSIFALGTDQNGENWKVTLDDDIAVSMPPNSSVGCSGTAVLGKHICDGRTGKVVENPPLRVWAFSPEAAVSDALSTAFMILDSEKISYICNKYNLSAAVKRTPTASVEFFGLPLKYSKGA